MPPNFWDKRAKKYDNRVQNHDALYVRSIEAVKSMLSASDVALDLGCASGEYSLDLARFVRRIHGIDTSTRMIALATQKARDRSVDNATFAPVDVFDRSLDARGYSIVLAFNLLHLVDDIRAVMGRVHMLLPTGGLFISHTPCLSDAGLPFRLFVAFAQTVKMVPPILSLTASELKAGIAGTGFDIAESAVWDRKKAMQWIVARKRARIPSGEEGA